MPCRLCLKEKPVQNSHIVPEFVYKELYNEKHQLFAARTLFAPNAAPSVVQGPFKVLSGLDYRNLKLFLLSILWRFGETSLPMLTGAHLGTHSEILRRLFDGADPGHHSLYSCVITNVSLNGKSLRQWIIPPKRSRADSHWVWNMVLGSYLLSFYVSNHPPPAPIALMALSPEGTLRIYQSDIRQIPSLLQIALRLRKADI
jgi:hypothetical protein